MAASVDLKLLKQTKFPPEFSQKVDMKKVNIEVMKKWIAGKISEILGSDDDVVTALCSNLIEGERFPNIKVLQIQLTGFLDKDTPKFCKELWTLCLSAQSNPQGVPKELLEAKKLELIQEKIEAEKAAEAAQKQKEQEKARDKNIEQIRQRERGERGRGGGGGGGRGRSDRGSHDFERRARESRSPPPRRRSPRRSPRRRPDNRAPPLRREMDTYIPNAPPRRRSGERRRWSPSFRRSLSRSLSRSRSPPRARPRDNEYVSSRRHYSSSRSPSPARRGIGRDRGRRNLGRGDDRVRSFTPSETSRSRSPRRIRRRRSPSILSRSPTPPPRSRRNRRTHSSVSPRARSRSLDRNRDRRRSFRSRRSPSQHRDHEGGDIRADYRKGSNKTRDERRRSRSLSRSSPNQTRGARPQPPITMSRSRSPPDRRKDRKRHRSIQRYAPAGRRRRNTSSVSSPIEKRRKTADSSGDEGNRQQRPKPTSGSSPKDSSRREEVSNKHEPPRDEPHGTEKSEETQSPSLTATELREKLLREKFMALRKSNHAAKEQNQTSSTMKDDHDK